LAWLFFHIWSRSCAEGKPRNMLEIAASTAQMIRQNRDIYLEKPPVTVIAAAEIAAIRDVPEGLSFLIAATEIARRGILLS